ncbi:hypothetical protein B0T16DRAFT_364962 [Cercophora newfieldiana]|uniref:Zinc finger PHD-type domain-containing protein n=1 Tax=Cercophora newfieldiana TaxID=92897 RepID=A0AA40CZA8_9PEZI|nr:hypothetical protein B0T16DRAFT_364962 [Cercophora newfieldiana]
MPAARKRSLREVETEKVESPAPPSMLHRIRNMWQFANLFQFILLFGKALKMDDDLDIEDLEAECLKPGAPALQDIGLCFLKFISSHRGLTHDLFDEYTRRQFLAKAPEKNPFGTEEAPLKFADFDVFTKIRVLQAMTQIIMMNPERLREKTEEQKDQDQTNWRIEPYGWDEVDRTYFVLDDNRIYRLTEAPPPAPKPKKNTKKAKAAQRSSKRRRVSAAVSSDAEDAGDEESEHGAVPEPEDDGLGGMKWECIAVTLDEVQQFVSGLKNSKGSNEGVLKTQLLDHLVPILEKQEESRKKKQLQREKELLNLEKLAHAKRSSRLAGKAEQQRAQEQAREEERKRQEEEAARRKEEAQRLKMERERDKRLMSREQRLRERETRRLQHEEELAQLSEDSKSTSTGPGRMSERRRLVEIEKAKQALKEIEEEEDDWIFDCVCGFYGQVDDGTHSVACEKCNVWQHSKCLGIGEDEAEKDDFHFVCTPCRTREQEMKEQRPRIIKIKVNKTDSSPQAGSSSPPVQRTTEALPPLVAPSSPIRPSTTVNQTPNGSQDGLKAESAESIHQANGAGRLAVDVVSTKFSPNRIDKHPFSSPHPTLSPPISFDKSRSYNTISNGPASSELAGNGNGISPSKQPTRVASPPSTKNTEPEAAEAGSSAPASLPHLTPAHPSSSEGRGNGSPLLPPHAGLSPTKQQPPTPQPQGKGNTGSFTTPSAASSFSAIFPPAALSPSPHQQILTPPVKSAEPPRAVSLEKA